MSRRTSLPAEALETDFRDSPFSFPERSTRRRSGCADCTSSSRYVTAIKTRARSMRRQIVGERIDRRGRRPMQILEDDQHRSWRSERQDRIRERAEKSRRLALGRERSERRQRSRPEWQFGEDAREHPQRKRARGIAREHGQGHAQRFGDALIRRGFRRRGASGINATALRLDGAREFADEPRLADAGLSGDKDAIPEAARRAIEASGQPLSLCLSPDERERVRAPTRFALLLRDAIHAADERATA